ncbi:MAG: HAD family hydrolase, partial [Chloroflexota bacterium]|nr:HAD family hydrolase [Chloroflexota bacterium]
MFEYVRAVFLDAGLTLVYSEISLPHLAHEVGRERGLDTSLQALEEAVPRASAFLHHTQRSDPDLWSSDERVRGLWVNYYSIVYREAGVGVEEATLDACSAEIYSRYLAPGAWKLYPDVLPTLMSLRERGYTLGVIS